jgi:hypothetical protein
MPAQTRIAVAASAIPDPEQRHKVSEALSRVLAPMRDGPWKAELAGADGIAAWTLRLYTRRESTTRALLADDQNVRGVVRAAQSALFTKWPPRPRTAGVSPSAASRRR